MRGNDRLVGIFRTRYVRIVERRITIGRTRTGIWSLLVYGLPIICIIPVGLHSTTQL